MEGKIGKYPLAPIHNTAGPLEFFVLSVDKELLIGRMLGRDHFMPASLLASQLAALELGADVTVIENTEPAAKVAERIVTEL